MIKGHRALSTSARICLIILALLALQLATPDSNLVYLKSNRAFCFTEEIELHSIWSSVRRTFEDAFNKLENAKLTQKIINHDFSNTKTFKIVKVVSKRIDGAMSWPVIGKISSGFGMRRHPVTRKRSFHNGIDIKAKRGTKVSTPISGKVLCAGRAGLLGRLVKIKSKNGAILYFAHLNRYKCKKGQWVKKGQIIGTVGSSGRATGPHLHFSIKKNGKYLNPLRLLSRK